MGRHVCLPAALGIALLALGAGPALAAFPGRDGRIAYTDSAASGEAIFAASPNGRRIEQLTFPSGTTDTDPAWSADGTRLAFTRVFSGRDSRVMLTSSFGVPPRMLTPEGTALIESEPSFSPDGQVAFRGRPVGSSYLSGEDEIYRINLDGSALTALTDTPGFAVQEPAWSPDGRRIAYSLAPADGSALGPSDVYVLDLASGVSSLVTTRRPNADDDDASWRADGERLIYERERRRGLDDLATVRPNGRRNRLILRSGEGTHLRDPAYSPSGNRIVVHRTTRSRAGLAIYNVEGKRTRFLAPATENESDWQPRP